MRKIETKQDLEKWIIEANNVGYAIPCVLNGGGFSWINDWEDGIEQTGKSLSDDEDYEDVLEYLKPGEEYTDFRDCMTKEELEGVVFVMVKHRTGYNQENFDYQFGIYEIIEIE